jgi:serine/threonine-protein kinase
MDVRVVDILAHSDAEIREKFQDRPRVEIRLRRTIGIAYRHLGKLAEAQANLERALAVAREVHAAEDPVVLDAINSMIALYDERGLFELSEPLHRELIDLRIRVDGQQARRTLGAMCNLGLFYYDLSRFDEAEVQLRTTLERMQQSMEPDDEYLINCMQGLGTALMGLGRLQEARALFEEVLERTETTSDGSHLLTINAVGNLAEVARLEGNQPEALDLLDDVLERCSRTLPDDHWRVGTFLYTRSAVLEALGRRDEALEECLRAREIYVGAFGPAHAITLAADERVGRLHEELGRSQEAAR